MSHSANAPRPILILGPTAGGKSELAVELAERLDPPGEVLSADSMQIYRHLDAGTAKPEPELRQRVPHHLIDIVEPTESFSVAQWWDLAEQRLAELQSQGKRPILVGGTNLYIKVFLEGMLQSPARDEAFRASLDDLSSQDLHRRLQQVDPASADRIHPNDRKRLTRALEVHHVTGQPLSAQQTHWTESTQPETQNPASNFPAYRHHPILLALRWPTEPINRRINARVRLMFYPAAAGQPERESLPDEVRRLEAAGLLGPQAREALGYKQVLASLHGECSLEEAFEQTKIQTRRFAKQQRTWLRRFRGIRWLDAAAPPPDRLADEARRIVRETA